MPGTTHSTISANSLFHFTRSKENLEGILQNEFLPRYALENLNINEPEIPELHVALPMVSFCDIPLSQVRDHILHYGEYALGLTKDWAKAQGIAPVVYTYPGALTSSAIGNIYGNLPKTIETQNLGGLAEAQGSLLYLSFFMKRYEGKMYRNGEYSSEIVRFYNEREWRYLPPMQMMLRGEIKAFLPKTAFDDPDQRTLENDSLGGLARLGFRPRDIKYVIVKSESEILDVLDSILRIKGPNFGYDEVRKLSTRIVTMDQIREDF